MAGWPRGDHVDEDRIAIAIDLDVDHPLAVAGSLTFVPQLRAAATPEPCFAALLRFAQRLFVHPGDAKEGKVAETFQQFAKKG